MVKKLLKTLLSSFPIIINFYRLNRDFINRIYSKPIITKFGFSLVGNKAMASGDYENNETNLFLELIDKNELFINVGANIGYYCCLALSKGKRVIAFEPIAQNIYYLIKNISLNGWSKHIEIYPLCLSKEVDILNIYGGDTGASLIKGWASIPETFKQQLPVSTLDNIVNAQNLNKKTLIMVDIEGAELMFLQGATKTLLNNPKPTWIVEICLDEHQPISNSLNPNFVNTFEIFFNAGYKCFTADNKREELNFDYILSIANGSSPQKNHNYLFTE